MYHSQHLITDRKCPKGTFPCTGNPPGLSQGISQSKCQHRKCMALALFPSSCASEESLGTGLVQLLPNILTLYTHTLYTCSTYSPHIPHPLNPHSHISHPHPFLNPHPPHPLTELEEVSPIINWSSELVEDLDSRLYPLWNRTAGDCLLDSTLQATWGVVDRDATLRSAMADSLVDGASR